MIIAVSSFSVVISRIDSCTFEKFKSMATTVSPSGKQRGNGKAHIARVLVLIRLGDIDLVGMLRRAEIGRGVKAGNKMPVAPRNIDIHKAFVCKQAFPLIEDQVFNRFARIVGIDQLLRTDGCVQQVCFCGSQRIL